MKFITEKPFEDFFNKGIRSKMQTYTGELLILTPFLSQKGVDELLKILNKAPNLKVKLVVNLSKTNVLLSATDPAMPINRLKEKLKNRLQIRNCSSLHAKSYILTALNIELKNVLTIELKNALTIELKNALTIELKNALNIELNAGLKAMAGSSNLTMGGLERNRECNFSTTKKSEIRELSVWYKEIWEHSSTAYETKLKELTADWKKYHKLREDIQKYTGSAYHLGKTSGIDDWGKIKTLCKEVKEWPEADLLKLLNQPEKTKSANAKINLLCALGILVESEGNWQVTSDAVKNYSQEKEPKAKLNFLTDLEDIIPGLLSDVKEVLKSNKNGLLRAELTKQVNHKSHFKYADSKIFACVQWLKSLGFVETKRDSVAKKDRYLYNQKI